MYQSSCQTIQGSTSAIVSRYALRSILFFRCDGNWYSVVLLHDSMEVIRLGSYCLVGGTIKWYFIYYNGAVTVIWYKL